MNTVVLILQSGGAFNFYDVELLAFHLRKQWYSPSKLRILCLFNEINIPHSLVGLELIPTPNKQWSRWWCKMNLFSPDMDQYRPFLFMDLDTAIVNNLEGILPPTGHENKFITLGGFNGLSWYLLSGLMWFPTENNKVSKIWNQWIQNPGEIMKRFRKGDQDFIKSVITDPDIRWQQITDKICNFKPLNGRMVIDREIGWSQRVLDVLPKQSAVICFHGRPRIYEAMPHVDWVRNYIENSRK